jgi:hypothetical protein
MFLERKSIKIDFREVSSVLVCLLIKEVAIWLTMNDSLLNLIIPIKNVQLITAHWRTIVEHDMPNSLLIIVELTIFIDIFSSNCSQIFLPTSKPK